MGYFSDHVRRINLSLERANVESTHLLFFIEVQKQALRNGASQGRFECNEVAPRDFPEIPTLL